jgi:ribonucleotide monophosphatase NagD (HAD superfamily)
MVAAIETAAGVKAELIGKPKTISLVFLLKELGHESSGNPQDVWVIGDRLETDIVCGNTYGAHTVLVTTGIADRHAGESAVGQQRPEYIIDSLSELPSLIGGGHRSNSAARIV